MREHSPVILLAIERARLVIDRARAVGKSDFAATTQAEMTG